MHAVRRTAIVSFPFKAHHKRATKILSQLEHHASQRERPQLNQVIHAASYLRYTIQILHHTHHNQWVYVQRQSRDSHVTV